jgi:two-component sensor histidine kinase
MWEQYMGLGITGGIVLNGKAQGAAAANIALKVLYGESPENIPVMKKSPNVMILDYNQLKRFDMDQSRIPAEAIILNSPLAGYKRYGRHFWTVTGGLAVLSLLVILMQRIRAQREIAQANIQLRAEVEERVKAERELRNETSVRNVLLDNLPCIAMVLKKGTREIVASNAVAKKAGAFPGQTCYEAAAQGSTPCAFCLAPETWDTNQPRYKEAEHQGKWYEMYWVPFGDELYVHYIFDITGRKKGEEDQKRLQHNLESLWGLAKLQDENLTSLSDYVLDEITRLSSSRYGFYGFMNEEESVMSIHSWSRTAMKDCAMSDRPVEFPIEKAGVWGDAVRKRGLVMIDDYQSDFTGKGGIPEGHVALTRLLAVPVFSGDKIVAVGAVANKETAYTLHDIEQMSSFLTSAQLIMERKKMDARLRSSLEEKQLLLQEIHHRVKNNFQIVTSLLRLQGQSIQDERMSGLFKDSENRIRSMSLVHEMLYRTEDLARIDFGNYIRMITNNLHRTFSISPDRIALKSDIDRVSFSVDTAIPLGLAINEIVSNAMKHAFPGDRKGEIRIVMRENGKGQLHEIMISDNGVGIPPEIDFKQSVSLGLRLVSNMVEKQLGGRIELKRNGGTEFRIRIKAQSGKSETGGKGGKRSKQT